MLTVRRLLVFPLYLVASAIAIGDEVHPEDLSLLNRSGQGVEFGALRFSEAGWKKGRDQGFAIGLQKNTSYFYLWIAKPAFTGRPLCDGYLVDAKGSKVSVDSIKSFATADFDGNGSTYLVAIGDEGARLIAWKIDGCEGKDIFSAVADTQLPPAGGSASHYQRLVAGDFRNVGSDSIELIGESPAAMSEWSFSAGKFVFVSSAPLYVSAESKKPLSGIRYVTTTRLSQGEDNLAYQAAAAILHDRGYTLYRETDPIFYAPSCSVAPANCQDRVVLINVDQGFSDGLQDMARKDTAAFTDALNRMIKGLRAIPGTFKVWVLLDPIQEDRQATQCVLDALTAAGFPFILDYYSSDITNLASLKRNWLDYSPRAADPLKGVSLALHGPATEPDNLGFYAKRYGKKFVGLRFMERLGIDIQANDPSFPQMVSDAALAKDNLLFDWELAGQVMQWSKDNSRYVAWADPALYLPYQCYWRPDQVTKAAARRNAYVGKQRDFAAANPYLIPMYDNNEGLKRCGVARNKNQITPRNFRMVGWERIPESIATAKTGQDLLTGPHGFGISVQSWTTDSDPLLSAGTLPSAEMAIWILDALSKGAGMVELEPYFYLFDWPKGKNLPQSRAIPQGEKTGDARDTLGQIFEGVSGK